MSFRFQKAAAVAVGTFNMYIIQPPWLSQLGLLEEGVPLEMKADFNRPGFRYRARGSSLWWNVRPDRLILESESSQADCGEPLAKVLDVLKWTPLMGVGTNVEFEGVIGILDQIRCKLPDVAMAKGFREGQRTWHVAMVRGPQTFNFQVSAVPPSEESKEGKVSLSINVHTELSKERAQLKANEMAIAACKEFKNHRDEALAIAGEILGGEIHL